MCESLVLTVEEAAKLLRVSRGSAYEAVRAGVIPSISIGRRILIPRQLLLDAITQQGQTEREDEWHE
jgi:excisionase family DNA binding protein